MKKITFLTLLLVVGINIIAQNQKRELTFDDIIKWNRITTKDISNDGNIIVYKLEPWKGDPIVKISGKNGKELASINYGTNPRITNDSKFVIAKIKPAEEEIRQLKLKKTKKEDMPLDQLVIFNIETGNKEIIPNLKSFKVPEKWAGWIAYQINTEIKEDTANTEEKKEFKKESKENGFKLHIKNLYTDEVIEIPYVTDYKLGNKGEVMAFVSTGDDNQFKPGVYHFDLKTNIQTEIISGKGKYEQVTMNKDGSMLAFLADTSGCKKSKEQYEMYLWTKYANTKRIVHNYNDNMLVGWEISKHGKITFSESNSRVFFGTAPIKPEKDTTVLEEEIPVLDVWHWDEPTLHTQQLNKKSDDLKKTYLAVYHISENKMAQLETQEFTGIKLINKGDAEHVLAWSNWPYSVQAMWEGYPVHNDFYLIDINTGNGTMIKKDCRATPRVSPAGRYIYWYNAIDTSWNTYHLELGQEYRITNKNTVQCANELNDIPNPPSAYGMAGWLQNDEALLIYDRFDIWRIDPQSKQEPVNITLNGQQHKINYRYVNLTPWDDENKGIVSSEKLLLKGHNEITRADGYYTLNSFKSNPVELISGRFMLNTPIKAKDADVFIYTKEDFTQFPDLLATNGKFKKSKQISTANPQQQEFKWGTIELYSWTSLDGRKLEGLLAKPADFDPNKKYPMIVNFYEKSSQRLYNHRIPEAHRSTVDYHYYTSNGYIVFNPDVYYKTGYPGEDAFNCVMPGVTQLISEGFVDKNSIAAQGHSWGGYQVAYLATRTNLFAAIESGAPVVNMFSAYGGIRLWTGLNRSFQYEHTQSRIGKSIWEAPLRYLENSPLFTADKIQTPLLIMHNDKDGAVPISQGVEFFIALRRMGKQAWLLNYNEGDHWPLIVRDKYDFQVRLAQFFDHFLKGEPMPKWMKEGIPAVDKGFELGYEIIEE